MSARLGSIEDASADRIGAFAIALVLVLLLSFTVLDATGHRLFVVDGSSMEPAIPRGALIVVRSVTPDEIAVGDVVTYQHRGATVTHRVVAIDETSSPRVFTTRGDANAVADPDPVTFDDRVGLLVARIPLVGYVLALLQWSARPLSIVLALLFTLWAVRGYRARPFPLFART